MNFTIFDMMYPKYKIQKPIRLIEMFAGYGSQALTLKYLGVEFEHWKICEWAIKSIQAYKDIHFPNEYHPYGFMEESKDELAQHLYNMGISSNYNEPMTLEQIKRLSLENLATICENIYVTNNLVNIQKVKGTDLEIVDTDKYDYVMTYSFPCQDLSLAGKGKGMSDTSTRSGMLWEVERILTECKELGTMPQILLMENVPQVHSVDNMPDFHKWQVRLEELGYKSYWQDLIATDYGIPQTRNRCFMVSILGNYSYTFPKPIPLKLKLKDMLEDDVDDKYWLSDELVQHIQKTAEEHEEYTQYDRYNGDLEMWCRVWKDKSPTLNTKCQDTKIYANDTKILGKIKQWHQRGFVYDENNSMTTICATDYKTPKLVGINNIKIKNATKKGYLEATDGDGVDISSRMEHHRGTVQKGMTQTITTMGGENNGVVVNRFYEQALETLNNNKVKDGDIIDVYNQKVLTDGNSPTITTRPEGFKTAILPVQDLRIRKLTPRECFRLMGVKDENFDKVKKNQSDSSLYHLAGDSIVVNVLMAIFKELL